MIQRWSTAQAGGSSGLGSVPDFDSTLCTFIELQLHARCWGQRKDRELVPQELTERSRAWEEAEEEGWGVPESR